MTQRVENLSVHQSRFGDDQWEAKNVSWIDHFARSAGKDRAWVQSLDGGDNIHVVSFIRRVVEEGRGLLDKVLQPTQRDAAERLPGGRDIYMSKVVGYPLPTEPTLQRDFLRVDERKQRLEELRAAGDGDALAAYEKDCFQALFSASIAYKPPISENPPRYDNDGFADMAQSGSRGCGGIALQAAHWIQELGLEAFITMALESSMGLEGHIAFLTRNAKGELHFFDPALRIPYTPIPENFYKNQAELPQRFKEISEGSDSSFFLAAENTFDAYKASAAPSAIVRNLENGIRMTHFIWTLSDYNVPVSEKASLIKFIQDLEKDEHISPWIRMIIVKICDRMGGKEKTLAEVRKFRQREGKSAQGLQYAANVLFDLDQTVEGITVTLDFLLEMSRAVQDFFITVSQEIDQELATEKQIGLRYKVQRWMIMERLVRQGLDQIERLVLECQKVPELSKEKALSTLLREAKVFFCFYEETAEKIGKMLDRFGFPDEVQLTEKTTSLYAQLVRIHTLVRLILQAD